MLLSNPAPLALPLHISHTSTPHHRRHFLRSSSYLHNFPPLSFKTHKFSFSPVLASASSLVSNSVEHLECSSGESPEDDNTLEMSSNLETEKFDFDGSFDSTELKLFDSPAVEVKQLEELPEQWRRSRLAWLCKQLPAHKAPVVIRVLNAQRKWMRQADATYLVIHCMRICENETGFRVKFYHCFWVLLNVKGENPLTNIVNDDNGRDNLESEDGEPGAVRAGAPACALMPKLAEESVTCSQEEGEEEEEEPGILLKGGCIYRGWRHMGFVGL